MPKVEEKKQKATTILQTFNKKGSLIATTVKSFESFLKNINLLMQREVHISIM